jgi:hypothetical protein
MLSDDNLLGKVNDYIAQLGNEWCEMEDAGFWYESDLQARLLTLLWGDSDLWFPIELQGRTTKLPLTHAECPISRRRHFDLAIFWDKDVEQFAHRIRHIRSGWQKELQKIPVRVAIEIKSTGSPWNDKTCKDLHKILDCISQEQVKYGYLLIFYDSKKEPEEWQSIDEEITQSCARLKNKQDMMVYFSPCGNPIVKPRWLPKSETME